MSDTVLAIMIICITVIIVLIIFRDKLKSFSFICRGLKAILETHKPSGTDPIISKERNSKPTISPSTISNKPVMKICADYEDKRKLFYP